MAAATDYLHFLKDCSAQVFSVLPDQFSGLLEVVGLQCIYKVKLCTPTET